MANNSRIGYKQLEDCLVTTEKLAKANLDIGKSRFTNWQKTMNMTPNPTKEEIDALICEVEKRRKRKNRR